MEEGGILPPYVRITVSDTGYGMSRETMERIFDPLFTTKQDNGTGLGLSIVHKIVENHCGAVRVESRHGEGSVFHVYLRAMKMEV